MTFPNQCLATSMEFVLLTLTIFQSFIMKSIPKKKNFFVLVHDLIQILFLCLDSMLYILKYFLQTVIAWSWLWNGKFVFLFTFLLFSVLLFFFFNERNGKLIAAVNRRWEKKRCRKCLFPLLSVGKFLSLSFWWWKEYKKESFLVPHIVHFSQGCVIMNNSMSQFISVKWQ